MAKSQSLQLTFKKDFGLGQYRLALPDDNPPPPNQSTPPVENTKSKKISGSFKVTGKGNRLSAFGGKMKNLLQKSSSDQDVKSKKKHSEAGVQSLRTELVPVNKSPIFNDSLLLTPSTAGSGDLSDESSSGRPSPSLHSRVVKKVGILNAAGIKGSLENLRAQYRLTSKGNSCDQFDHSEDNQFGKLVHT